MYNTSLYDNIKNRAVDVHIRLPCSPLKSSSSMFLSFTSSVQWYTFTKAFFFFTNFKNYTILTNITFCRSITLCSLTRDESDCTLGLRLARINKYPFKLPRLYFDFTRATAVNTEKRRSFGVMKFYYNATRTTSPT